MVLNVLTWSRTISKILGALLMTYSSVIHNSAHRLWCTVCCKHFVANKLGWACPFLQTMHFGTSKVYWNSKTLRLGQHFLDFLLDRLITFLPNILLFQKIQRRNFNNPYLMVGWLHQRENKQLFIYLQDIVPIYGPLCF